MKKLLILTGPQGSGNHVWSKIFALHPAVLGWQALLETYWIGHDQEPFAACWRDPAKLAEFDWSSHDHYVTSISVPYMDNGQPTTPDIAAFIANARALGLQVKLVIVGRDRNIVGLQETRLRGDHTYLQALDLYRTLVPDHFLSYELLQLYRQQYLQCVEKELDFPMAWQHPGIDTIIETDANAKYFQAVEHHWVDELARRTSSKWH